MRPLGSADMIQLIREMKFSNLDSCYCAATATAVTIATVFMCECVCVFCAVPWMQFVSISRLRQRRSTNCEWKSAMREYNVRALPIECAKRNAVVLFVHACIHTSLVHSL